MILVFSMFFFKQKTAYEMRISDWSSDVCSSDLTLYGLGAGVWSRNGNTAYRMGRAIQAGRVWTNCYHAYPAHAAFGGYKQSGSSEERRVGKECGRSCNLRWSSDH